MTLNPNWYLNATGQFQQIGSGQIGISTTTTTGFLTFLSAASTSGGMLVASSATTVITLAQGTAGTWLAIGKLTATDNAAVKNWLAQLSDGTTIIDAANSTIPAINTFNSIALAGIISAPAGNIRLTATVATSGNTTILSTANAPGISTNLSVLSVIRIA